MAEAMPTNARPGVMPIEKYRSYPEISLPDRTWPDAA